MRSHRLPWLVVALLHVGVSAQSQSPAPETGVVPTGEAEEVTVRLGEVQILVTDKDGKAIRDLKVDEIEVREAGEKRRIQSLEPFATRDISSQVLPQPTPLVGQETAPSSDPVVVLPPPPIRRIVFLFDAFNSRTPDRAKWVEAARQWVKSEMRADDVLSVAYVARGEVRIVLPWTSERILIETTLSNSSFLDSIDYYDSVGEMKLLMSDLETCDNSYDQANCARNAAQPYIFEWRTRAETTIAALKRFAGSMLAIPGRKAVLYMSDGVVQDAGEMALMAVLGKYGTDRIDVSRLRSTLQRNVYQEIQALNRISSGSDVTFFTFDTRPSSRAEVAGSAEQREYLSERMVADPFQAMFTGTRGMLDSVAIGTGGRSYHGPQILKSLPQAASAIEGLYTLTFYRDPSVGSDPKLKIKVSRRNTLVSFPDKFDPRRHKPLTLPLELAVGKTRPYEDRWLMPVLIQLPLAPLPFNRDSDTKQHQLQLGIYGEADAPEGRRGGASYELVNAALDDRQFDERVGKFFTHTLEIKVVPGPYRLRVRISDSNSKVSAERAIDITLLADGSVVPGIQKLGPNQEGGRESVAPVSPGH